MPVTRQQLAAVTRERLSPDHSARAATAEAKALMFEGNARQALITRIARLTESAELRDRLTRHADTTLNLVRRIPASVAGLYTGKLPQRSIGTDATYTATIDRHIKGGLDAFMGAIHERAIAFGKVGVRPVVLRNGTVRLRVYDPHRIVVIMGDDGEPEVVALQVCSGDQWLWQVWTADSYATCNNDMADVTAQYAAVFSPDANNPTVNPYGIIPVAWFGIDMPIGNFWGPAWGTDGLHDAALSAMTFGTELGYQTHAGAFKQIAIKGNITDEELAKIVRDSAAVMVVEPGSDVQLIEPTANIDGMRTAIHGAVEDGSTGFGMSLAQFQRTSQAVSGLSRSLERAGISDVNKRHMGPFRLGETELCEIFRRMFGHHGIAKIPDGEFVIQFFEPEVERDADQKFRQGMLDFTLNVRELEDVLGWAPGSAESRMTEIKAHNDKLRALMAATLAIPPGSSIAGVVPPPVVAHHAEPGTDPTRTPADGARGPVSDKSGHPKDQIPTA
jgi:hypothetical protein